MKKQFTQKLKQSFIALFLIMAGLLLSGKTNASCNAHMRYQVTGLSVSFTDSGSSALAHSHSALWSFGDGSSSTSDNPTHVYSHNGTYVVCLVMYDSSTSCMDSTCTAIYVANCSLTPTYTYTVTGRTVHFDNTTTTSGTTTYIWHFGDGDIDSTSGDTVSHLYSGTSNDFYTTLTVYEHSSTCMANGYVHVRLCSSSAGYHTSTSGHNVQFYADSSNASGVTYAWTFGDGGTSTSAGPYHTYTNTGVYNVCLTATDPVTSCTSVNCQNIQIVDPTYCISGTVSLGSGLVGACRIYLISFDASDSSLTALDSTQIHDSIVSYYFCNLAPGTYYTKAALFELQSQL